MSVLEDLLTKVVKLPLDEQVKQLSDKIMEEETKLENYASSPKGPNIFISLEVPGPTKDLIAFVCLERESEGKYIVSLRTFKRSKLINGYTNSAPIKTKVWEVNEDKAERILIFYAKKYKLLKGE